MRSQYANVQLSLVFGNLDHTDEFRWIGVGLVPDLKSCVPQQFKSNLGLRFELIDSNCTLMLYV